jgi:hypothetical protein
MLVWGFNDKLITELWSVNGLVHRESEHAYVNYNLEGLPSYVEYYINGKLHIK